MSVISYNDFFKKKKKKEDEDDIAPTKKSGSVISLEDFAKENDMKISLNKSGVGGKGALGSGGGMGSRGDSYASLSDDELSKKEKELQEQLLNYDRKEKRKWWNKEDNVLENAGNVLYKLFAEKQEDKYAEDDTYDSLKAEYDAIVEARENKYVENKEYKDGFKGYLEKVEDVGAGNVLAGIKGIETTAKKILGQTPEERLTEQSVQERLSEKARKETTGIGAVGLDVVGGISRQLPNIVLGGGNAVLNSVTAFANFGGGAYNEAKRMGVSEERATAYGVTIGGLELVLNKILPSYSINGKNVFGKTATDKVLSKMMSKITNNAFLRRTLTEGAGEFTEEYLQEFLDPIIRETILEEDNKVGILGEDDIGEIAKNIASYTADNFFSKENAYAGMIGALTSATMGAPSNIDAYRYEKATGRNYETKLTQNEQTVVDKVTEQRTAERQKQAAIDKEVNKTIKAQEKTFGALSDGEKKGIKQRIQEKVENGEIDIANTKLSKKDIEKIQQEVREDLEKGYIDIDTIDSTFSAEKTTQIKQLQEELSNTKDDTKKAEIQTKINELTSARASELQGKFNNDIYLQRSYIENAKKSEKFTYEAKETDSDYRKTLTEEFKEKANNTNKTHETYEMLVKLSEEKGTQYHITNTEELKNMGYDVEGSDINGLVRVDKDGSQRILINIDSNKAINRIVGHETTHLLEGTKEYKTFQEYIKNYAKAKGEYDTRYKQTSNLYSGIDADIDAEVTADLVGDYLFTDTDFINNLSVEQTTIFQKIYAEIKHLYNLATAGSKEARELERVKKAFDKAYKQNASNMSETDTKFSLTDDLTTVQQLEDRKQSLEKQIDKMQQEGNTDWRILENEVMAIENKIDKLNSNTKYSLSDNKGRTLTKEQQDFFKDSKARDENGNLLTVYHGTRADFNVFDNTKSGDNYDGWSHSGKGFYFTDSESEAQEYGDYSLGDAETTLKEVYLNITNPFDTSQENTPALAKIGEEYGVDPYYLQRGDYLLNWFRNNDINAAEVLQKYGYDGIIDYGHYVAFNSNQIKNVDNTNPTTDADIRYSLSEKGILVDDKGNDVKLETSDAGITGTLMAMHGITESKLKGLVELGGIPVGSLAITKSDADVIQQYGDYVFLFDKSTIDPSNKQNEVYGSDVYSPRFPQTVQKVNEKELSKLQNYLGKRLSADDTTLEDFKSNHRNDIEFVDKFLEENNIKVEDVYKDADDNYGFSKDETMRKFVIDNDVTYEKLFNDNNLRNQFYDIYRESSPMISFAERKIGTWENIFNKGTIDVNTASRFDADFNSIKNGAEKVIDVIETNKAKRELIKEQYNKEYDKFLNNKLSPIFEGKYIRNNKELYTPSGNRRSFNQLYDEYTLDNVVKQMKGKVRGEEGFFYGAGTIRSLVTPQFKSIEEIKANEHKLVTGSEMKNIKEEIDFELNSLSEASKEFGGYSYDSFENALSEIARLKKITNNKAKEIFNEYGFNDVSNVLIDKSIEFLEKLKNAPTEYFEAKPQRAIGLDEAKVLLVPSDIDPEFKQQLQDKGLNLVEYDKNIEGDKQSKINQFDDLKFSLSNQNEAIAPVRGDIFGSNIKLQVEEAIAPIKEEIAELKETLQSSAEISAEDEYAPITEVDLPMYEEQSREAFRTIEDTDSPYEVEDFAPVSEELTTTESLFETRDYAEVGSKKINAYQYDNPEVRPYFQQAAREMLNDLDSSVKGERYIIGDNSQMGNGDYYYSGNTRHTTNDIAELLDGVDGKYKYSYAEIRKGLQAIIEDNGAENNAASKRIEFYLDKRLREGYTDIEGYKWEADKGYLDTLRAKEISDYYGSLPIGEAPVESIVEGDIAPVDNASNTEVIEEIAPIENGIEVPVQRKFDLDNQTITDENVSKLEKKQQREYKKLGSKEDYISNKAFELYNEVKGLRKGVKASYELGRVLDVAFAHIEEHTLGKTPEQAKEIKNAIWRRVTTSLLNVKAKPLETVNKNSKIEAVIRQNINKEYDSKKNDIANMKEEDLVTKTKKELRKALLIDESDFFSKALDSAKNRSMALMNNTDTIRNTELVFGRENGRKINEIIFQKEIDNEADSIAWQNQERDDIKSLGIKARSKESAAVQKYGEKQYVEENGKVVSYTDEDLAREFPNVATQNKIKNAAKVIRSKYDAYIDSSNEVLTKLGFDPIPKRKDYMRHFQELNDVFSRFGIPFNANSMTEHVLPTDINGLTENWSPQKNYFASMQQRKGLKTTYDAITGIDGYIGGIANLIYHTEDIQRGRAFEELIRETYGEDKGFDNLENLPDELKQARIEKIQDNHLSNYAAWVHEWTNNIAGKKSKVDRSVEAMFGRKVFTLLDETRKQVGSNMIGFNLSSSLTNLIAPVQAMAKTNKLAVVKGTADTIKNIFVKDNFMNNNKFLVSRMGSDMISKNAWQKIQDAGFVFMKGMDWFSSNQIVRSKYYELRSKGMSEEQAHAEAGQFAARILGDRTKGANAQLYNSKLIGLVTQFQLEVNNQLYSTFYDTYHESKENAQNNALKTAAGMTFTLGQLFAFTHLFGKTFEAIAGYNPTLDVIGILKTAFGWGEDDEDEEKTTSERLKAAADQLVDSLPYVNILTGGGRIPVASGIPNLVAVATGGKDEYGNEVTLEDELKKLLYLIPPTGGNQVKKTTQGLGMFDDELPVSGSYTDSGNLRFPVEDTVMNRIQAGIFGQYANENAGNYFDNKRQPLKEKQIQEYADLDMPIADYWEYREGLKEQSTTQEKFDYINSLDVSDKQKNIMINNALDRKEPIDMSNYGDFGGYDEFDYATKNPDKYRVIEQIDTFDNYVAYKEDIASIKEQFSSENGYSTEQRKAAVQQYIQSLNLDVPQKIMLEKMAGGYSIKNYKGYIQSYIESLPLTAEEKQAIDSQLFK